MEELQTLIADLPGWLQLIILAVVGVGVVLLRRQKAKKPSTPGALVTPGQSGPNATRDLTASEIRALTPAYAPTMDGTPDPGEVVWTWVPYVEQDGRGKDRPVLIIARVDDGAAAGCYLSTKEHRGFIHVGPGAWDSKGRPSYLNPDRVLLVSDHGVRREGAVMPRSQFDRVVSKLQSRYRNA